MSWVTRRKLIPRALFTFIIIKMLFVVLSEYLRSKYFPTYYMSKCFIIKCCKINLSHLESHRFSVGRVVLESHCDVVVILWYNIYLAYSFIFVIFCKHFDTHKVYSRSLSVINITQAANLMGSCRLRH